MSTVLVLDDRPNILDALETRFADRVFKTQVETNVGGYLASLELSTDVSALVLDMQLSEMTDLDFERIGVTKQDPKTTDRAGLALARYLVGEGGPIERKVKPPAIILTSAYPVSPEDISELAELSSKSGVPIRFVPKRAMWEKENEGDLRDWLSGSSDAQEVNVSGLVDPTGLPLKDAATILRTTVERVESFAEGLVEQVRRTPSALNDLTPRGFEEFVAHLLSRMGYEIELTPYSRDGGVDIYAHRQEPTGKSLVLVECKAYAPHNPVQVELVRTLFGTIHDKNASRGILATTSYFSRGAQDFAERHQYRISLQDRHAILHWVQDQT